MAHTHPVVDSDSRFVINFTTRAISTTSDKIELIQGYRPGGGGLSDGAPN